MPQVINKQLSRGDRRNEPDCGAARRLNARSCYKHGDPVLDINTDLACPNHADSTTTRSQRRKVNRKVVRLPVNCEPFFAEIPLGCRRSECLRLKNS